MKTSGWAIVRYTALRFLLFGFVWLLLQLTTPLRGLIVIVLALLISGVISIVVLNRQRAAMGSVLAGFFRRINTRIEESARAEDAEDDIQRLSESNQNTQGEAVDKNE